VACPDDIFVVLTQVPGIHTSKFSAQQTSCGLSRGVTGRYPASAWPCPPNHSCLLSFLFLVVVVSMLFSFSTLAPLALALVARVAAQSTGTDCARTCFPPVLQIDAAEGPSKCISDGVSKMMFIPIGSGLTRYVNRLTSSSRNSTSQSRPT